MAISRPLSYWQGCSCNYLAASRRAQSGGRNWLWLKVVIALNFISFQHFLLAETVNGTISTDKAFYQQLLVNEDNNKNSSHSIAQHRLQTFIAEFPADTETVDFNQLWIQQHQPDYRYKDGGAALGRLLRMGAKAFYRNRYGGNNIALANAEEDFNGSQANVEYRLRVSGNEMQLKIEYDF